MKNWDTELREAVERTIVASGLAGQSLSEMADSIINTCREVNKAEAQFIRIMSLQAPWRDVP